MSRTPPLRHLLLAAAIGGLIASLTTLIVSRAWLPPGMTEGTHPAASRAKATLRPSVLAAAAPDDFRAAARRSMAGVVHIST